MKIRLYQQSFLNRRIYYGLGDSTDLRFIIDLIKPADSDIRYISSLVLTNEEPIVTEHNPSLYRMVVRKKEGKYYAFVGDNMVRIFDTDEDLPHDVATKLAMIKAFGDGKGAPTSTTGSPRVRDEVTYPNEFKDIGWQASDGLFCVIIHDELLSQLRGQAVQFKTYSELLDLGAPSVQP